jgi:hypothetical protein
MSTSPIPYVQAAKPQGTLFGEENPSGLISVVDTSFFVDHDEPLRALEAIKRNRHWPLGDLPDGYEYLLMLEIR